MRDSLRLELDAGVHLAVFGAPDGATVVMVTPPMGDTVSGFLTPEQTLTLAAWLALGSGLLLTRPGG